MEKFSLNNEDRQLSGSFERNRGILPVPITGPYVIVSHYGQYAVDGLRNVKLDNKGMISKVNREHRHAPFLMEKFRPFSNIMA